MNISAQVKNINSPVIEYGSSSSSFAPTMDGRAGISLCNSKFFNIVVDLYLMDIEEKKGAMRIEEGYGLELYPFSSLALRGGFTGDNWRAGLGIISRDVNIDYAYIDREEGFKHSIQYTIKFAPLHDIKEKELLMKEKMLKKDGLYNRARTEYNKEKIALASQSVQQYVEKYGEDKRVLELNTDITEWLNEKREKNMGRADELKKEILKDYYRGKINEAQRKLSNMKLLAPNYEGTAYLTHLIKARLLLEEGKYRESENELVEALKINPDGEEVIGLHKRLQEVLKLSEEE